MARPRQRCSGEEPRVSGTTNGWRLPAAMLAAAMLAHGPAAAAQAKTRPEPAAARAIGEVRVITFATQVIDSRGQPVRGLARWDFTLRVDGVDTPVDYLTEVRDGQPCAPSLAQLAAPGPVVEVGPAAQKEAGSYYLLGFTVDRTADARRHELRVEVARHRVAVRAPSGYFESAPDSEIAVAIDSVQPAGADGNACAH
ncbi:MAG: hypothetical protein JOZ15_17140 [Acidobacteria bacterium]|nr:hypothetical protein [Acidobacteriota bacterium]